AKSASDVRKACVIELWNQHLRAGMKGELMKAALQKQIEQEMTPPEPDPNADQPTPEQQAQMECAAAAQQQDAQAQSDEHKARLNVQTEAANHEMSEQAKDADAARQKDLATHQTALDIAAARSMPQQPTEGAQG